MQSKTVKLYENMSLYQRQNSKNYYACVYHNQKQYRKSLKTENINEAKKLCFAFANDLFNNKQSALYDTESLFSVYADKFLEIVKQQNKITASGSSSYEETKRFLNRENGIRSFFDNKIITDISRTDVVDYLMQIEIEKKQLSKSTINKHLVTLRQILDLAEHYIKFPKNNGVKSQRRGFFDKNAYRKIRDKSIELVGKEIKKHNGSRYEITEDLHDFIVFMMSSMLRPTVSEIYSIKFKDLIENTIDDTKYLTITNLNRKNKLMSVDTLETGAFVLRDMRARKDCFDDDYLFLNQYKNRRHAMRIMSAMFKHLLKITECEVDLSGNTCTAYSLRHTSIILNLLNKNITHIQIARRADTSLKMIDNFYYPESELNTDLRDYLRISR